MRGQYPTRHPEAGGGHSGHCASVAGDGRMARRRRRHARDSEAGSRLGAGRLDSPPSGLSKPWLGQGQLLCPERRLPAVFARLSWNPCPCHACRRQGEAVARHWRPPCWRGAGALALRVSYCTSRWRERGSAGPGKTRAAGAGRQAWLVKVSCAAKMCAWSEIGRAAVRPKELGWASVDYDMKGIRPGPVWRRNFFASLSPSVYLTGWHGARTRCPECTLGMRSTGSGRPLAPLQEFDVSRLKER